MTHLELWTTEGSVGVWRYTVQADDDITQVYIYLLDMATTNLYLDCDCRGNKSLHTWHGHPVSFFIYLFTTLLNAKHTSLIRWYWYSGGIGISISSLSLQRLNILKSSTQQFQMTDFSICTATSLTMHGSQTNKCIHDLLRNAKPTEIQHSSILNDRFQYTHWNISNHAGKSDE